MCGALCNSVMLQRLAHTRVSSTCLFCFEHSKSAWNDKQTAIEWEKIVFCSVCFLFFCSPLRIHTNMKHRTSLQQNTLTFSLFMFVLFFFKLCCYIFVTQRQYCVMLRTYNEIHFAHYDGVSLRCGWMLLNLRDKSWKRQYWKISTNIVISDVRVQIL